MKEFRYMLLANCFELAEIFEGVSASGDHALYPSRIGTIVSISPPLTRSRLREILAGDSLSSQNTVVSDPLPVRNSSISKGKNRKSVPSITEKMSAALDLILQPEPDSEPPGSSGGSMVTRAMRKLQEEYKNREGWTMEDLQLAYEMFENPVKAEIFLALISGEDQELWLQRQLNRFQSTI